MWERERVAVDKQSLIASSEEEKVITLAKFDEWAVHNLWANQPEKIADWMKWFESFNTWLVDVKQYMEDNKFSYLDIKHFYVLGLLDSYIFNQNAEINHYLVMLNQHRNRLADIIGFLSKRDYL